MKVSVLYTFVFNTLSAIAVMSDRLLTFQQGHDVHSWPLNKVASLGCLTDVMCF